MDLIESGIQKNSTFSLLYYSIIKKLCCDDSNEDTVKQVLIELFTKVAEEVRENKLEGFVTSPSG